MIEELLVSLEPSTFFQMCFAAVFIYVYIVLVTRIAGKRTFAKITSFDFAVTIAMGSILADAVNKPLANLMPALVSLALLATLQVAFSKLTFKSTTIEKLATNQPSFLMKDGVVIEENLKKCLVTRLELMGKLRDANVLQLSHVKAVVLETTGDISVLHSEESLSVDAAILEGVEG